VLSPKPLQRHLLLLIGGGGERKTLRVVARHAVMWNAFGTPEVVVGKRAVLDSHCAAVGRNPADIAVTLNVGIIVRDTPGEVQDRLDEIGEIAGFPDYAASNRPWGPPELVAKRLAEYAQAGVSEIIAVMPGPYDHQTIERLATEVAPRLRQLIQPNRPTP
jgi:alkanesulfonate monooxygenase SsuD/methylene tetrahydromethanopterin reductase-like flavin-dependent oxidoreductase (luciferase family)